jgi:hypothetical protein
LPNASSDQALAAREKIPVEQTIETPDFSA